MSGITTREAIRGIRGEGMRDAVRELMDQGWQALRWTSRNHLLLQHPTGARVTASCSASDRHAFKTFRRNASAALERQGQGKS